MVPHLSGGKYIMFKMEMQMRPFWKEMVRFFREHCGVAPYLFRVSFLKSNSSKLKKWCFPWSLLFQASIFQDLCQFSEGVSHWITNGGPIEYSNWWCGHTKDTTSCPQICSEQLAFNWRGTPQAKKRWCFLFLMYSIKFYQVTLASWGYHTVSCATKLH